MDACTASLWPAPAAQALPAAPPEDDQGSITGGPPHVPGNADPAPQSIENIPLLYTTEQIRSADGKFALPANWRASALEFAGPPDVAEGTLPPQPSFDVAYEASKVALDVAVAASISLHDSDSKYKAYHTSILLIGGGSALKGLGPVLLERQVAAFSSLVRFGSSGSCSDCLPYCERTNIPSQTYRSCRPRETSTRDSYAGRAQA